VTISEERMSFIRNIANDEWSYDLREQESEETFDKTFEEHELKWKKIREDYLTSSDSAEELHEFVKQHHWDEADDFQILIENPLCDKNTVRLIFWLAGPEFFRRNYASRDALDTIDQQKWWDLMHRSMENMATGMYKTEIMPNNYQENIHPDEYWENDPNWDIIPLMFE